MEQRTEHLFHVAVRGMSRGRGLLALLVLERVDEKVTWVARILRQVSVHEDG